MKNYIFEFYIYFPPTEKKEGVMKAQYQLFIILGS